MIYATIISAVVALFVVPILIAWAVPMGDFAPVDPVPMIGGVIAPIEPDPQLEQHACGYNAISAIYRSYGIDPDERRLRQRLGGDQTAWSYDSSTIGCIHPDIYRVLAQDGFKLLTPNASNPDAVRTLVDHLAKRHYALALIRRRQNGNLHWVVLTGFQQGKLQVCDSLAPAIYEEDLERMCPWRHAVEASGSGDTHISMETSHFRRLGCLSGLAS